MENRRVWRPANQNVFFSVIDIATFIRWNSGRAKSTRTYTKQRSIQTQITYLTAAVFKVHLPGIFKCTGSTELCHRHAGAVPRTVIRAGHWENAQKSCERSVRSEESLPHSAKVQKEKQYRNLLRSQADPVNGGKHLHWPVARSHWPRLLHSATAWALFVPVGMSANALPAGQVPARIMKFYGWNRNNKGKIT